MLSRDDIKRAMVEGHIKIYPFTPSNLTGIGYNLTTTHFAFSINQGILLTVFSKTENSKTTHFVVIPPNDTILFFTKEYIEVDNRIAGTFHSKVARVSEGLGHLSTTLDPTWKGQLLLSINNPTNKPITFDLDGDGNIITVLFHKLDSPVTGSNIHDNNKGRCELLIAHFCKAFPNKAYQEKHLELKEFIEKELADSLNGYDDFLENNTGVNPHSGSVSMLKKVLSRIQNDRLQIQEDRYALGEKGEYSVFRDDEEKAEFKRCVLYSLMEQDSAPDAKNNFEVFNKQLGLEENDNIKFNNDNIENVLPALDKCSNIIKFQLEQINHIRRIEWHNRRVHCFAEADSDLVLARKKERQKQKRKEYGVPIAIGAVIIAILFALFYFKILPFDGEKAVLAIFSTVIGAIVTLALSWWKGREKRNDTEIVH